MGDRENVVNERNVDPLIQLFKNNPTVLELLGKLWEALYVEGSTPDIGKRREHIIRTMLEEEFGLRVIEAPPMEREWDFSVVVGGEERRYSLKTTEKNNHCKSCMERFPVDREGTKICIQISDYVRNWRSRKQKNFDLCF